MSLVEFPSNTGRTITVDPDQVTAVRPYRDTVYSGAATSPVYDMSTIWVTGPTNIPRIHVCAWPVEQVKLALARARMGVLSDACDCPAMPNTHRHIGVHPEELCLTPEDEELLGPFFQDMTKMSSDE